MAEAVTPPLPKVGVAMLDAVVAAVAVVAPKENVPGGLLAPPKPNMDVAVAGAEVVLAGALYAGGGLVLLVPDENMELVAVDVEPNIDGG